MDALVFELEDSRFALATETVRELTQAVLPSSLPGAPAIVQGIVDIGGEVVPVLDVRRRFGYPTRAPVPSDHFIVATAYNQPLILPVDRVVAMSTIDPGDIHESKALGAPSPYVSGVARLNDGLCLIHSLESFLSDGEAADLAGALVELEGGSAQ
ncbi:MAG: chemotaxis protein CheW [Gammaproteobacteria bacterium]|nr:MAG: chemotaxis protein CheW [Gammaproteobacteria bacterium]